MSIFKDTFRPYVRKQLSIREELINIGNTNDSGIRTSRNSNNDDIILQTGDKINLKAGTFYNYTLNKQCIIRMTSMVDYVENVNLEVGGLEGRQSFNALRGATLSQNFILEGGVLSDYARVRNGKRETRRVDTPRQGFPNSSLKTNLGYGDLAIGADASSDGYGIVPMPGIVDINVRTKSAYGSLREAKVNFECHNRRQLEVLEMLYMRPGYMVTLEWGWNPYIKNDGTLYKERRLLEDFFRTEGGDSRIYTNKLTQQEVFNAINTLKEFHCGNYDGFLGFVKNFGFQAREDGGFTCFTELISIGEVIESLKMPNISIMDSVVNIETSEGGGSEGTSNIVIKRDGVNARGDERQSSTEKITKETFNKSLEEGIFPRYNGLLGLTKSLVNYATFNSFSQENRNYFAVSEFEEQQLSKVFTFIDDETVENADEKDAAKLKDAKSTAKGLASTARYNQNDTDLKVFLRNLIEFQSANVEQFLIKKLQLADVNELRNYIIPVGPPFEAQATEQREGKRTERNEQPYIRWDAFCALINETLITKDEKALNPVMIVADRAYDIGNPNIKSSKLDPLLYIPVSDFNNPNKNTLLDYSCDANICILPLQFETNTLAAEGDYIDSYQIEDSLGYIPDTSKLPAAYIDSIYKKESLTYNGNLISDSPNLDENDKVRRIGSIFLNINMLDNLATKNSEEEDYTLGKFLNDVWDEVNKVCPNHNFVITDDKESNTIFIIDLPVDNNEVPLDLHEFIPFSNKNILRSFEYTSNVPKAMSATIAIQSQDPRSIQDIDGVTFAAFNRSIKNRLLSTDTRSNFEVTKKAISDESNELLVKQLQLRQQIENYRLRFFSNLKLIANESDPIVEGNIKGITKEYQKNAAYISHASVGVSTSNSVIPLEFTAEIDGISGIVIGNMFKVDKSRLPRAYGRANIGFIVFNEDQKVTGQDWTTSISGKMTILPTEENKPKVDGVSSTTQTPDRSADSPASQTAVAVNSSDTLSQGQDLVTDIGQANTGDTVYLKKTKDNSIKEIGDETVTGSVGFTSVRSSAKVINETYLNGFRDNFRGLFNSWENAGRALGTIKASGGDNNSGILDVPYNNNTLRIKPDFMTQYFNTSIENGEIKITDQVTFKPFRYFGNKTIEIDGIKYHPIASNPTDDNVLMNAYNESGELIRNIETYNVNNMPNSFDPTRTGNTVYYIKDDHTTNIKTTWYNIQFSKGADEIFLNGASRFGDRIDLDGADDPCNIPLSEFSISNDCWMRFDTLAASRDSALLNDFFIGTDPEHIDDEDQFATDSAIIVENYRGFDIYQTQTGSYYTIPGVIIDGSIFVDENNFDSSIENVKGYIDRLLEE